VSDDAELLRTLAALREQYVAEAPGRLAALAAAFERARSGDLAALDELRQLLHRLAGSGGAYGLQAVTDTARAGELAAHSLLQQNTPIASEDARVLAEHLAAVAAAFRAAGASL
jgi:chemotaxis protein histidine kinase CheA